MPSEETVDQTPAEKLADQYEFGTAPDLAPLQLASVETTPPPPKHPARLVKQAEELGISEAHIGKLDTDTLWEWVDHLKGKQAEMQVMAAREAAIREAVAQRPQPQAEPATPPPAEDEFDLDEADYDPKLWKQMKKLHDENKELRAMRGELAEVKKREVDRVTTTIHDTIDDTFESLGAGFEKVVGKGARTDLDPKSAEMKRRIHIIQAAQAEGFNFAKATPKQIKARLKDVATELYGFAADEPAPAGAAEPYAAALGGATGRPPRPTPPQGPDGRFLSAEERRIKEQSERETERWNRSGLALPTQVNGAPEPKGVAKATRTVAEMMRQRATIPDDGRESGDAILDDFPG